MYGTGIYVYMCFKKLPQETEYKSWKIEENIQKRKLQKEETRQSGAIKVER